MLERLVEATYTRDRHRHLQAANLGLEKLRLLCRLAKDLGHLDPRRYEHAARAIDETGRLVGGWRMRRRRADGLFDRVAAFDALCAAALRAAAGKRRAPGPAFLTNLCWQSSKTAAFWTGVDRSD